MKIQALLLNGVEVTEVDTELNSIRVEYDDGDQLVDNLIPVSPEVCQTMNRMLINAEELNEHLLVTVNIEIETGE